MRGIGAIAENNKAAVITKLAQIIVTIVLLSTGNGILGVSIAYLVSGVILDFAQSSILNDMMILRINLVPLRVNLLWQR